jgi:chemotaxis protein CheX
MLGLEEVVEVTHGVLFPLLGDVDQLADSRSIPAHLLRGSVTITGTSNGIVTVDCSETLARRLAAAMFDAEPGALSEEDVLDSLGEVANIIGGNIKALLPGPSRLGLPKIDHDVSAPPDHTLVEQSFSCTGEPFRVSLAEIGS